MNKCLDKFNNKQPLETWDNDTIKELVDAFMDIRFPTAIALNKIDLPDSDQNIDRITQKYGQENVALISALSEAFLRKLHKENYIKYTEGTEFVDTADDLPDAGLYAMDEKTKSRLEKVQDLVLFRYGSTGIQECLKTVVDLLGLIPVFPVRNVNNFSSSTGTRQGGIFRDCFFVRPDTTMRQLATLVHPGIEKNYLYAETVGNVRLAEDELVTLEHNIVSFKTSHET